MTALGLGLCGLALCALLGLLLRAWPAWASRLSAVGPSAALALALPTCVRVLAGGAPRHLDWGGLPPIGSVRLELDALSALFLLLILTISALAALYGVGYLRRTGPAVGVSWFYFNLLVLSMALVVLARTVISFLMAWETMALTSFFLVAYERERPEARRAAWTYLVATHLGSLFLLPMFFTLMGPGGSGAFADFIHDLGGNADTWVFLLALVGFGTKAGLMPVHVWLPEAHPAAPSHVSALMSGVMIKTGIYGLLRVLLILGEPALWWGWILLLLGGASAFLGILSALGQHDLKRMLAYSSVENIGLIVMSLGLGVCGQASGSPLIATLGYAGALLHIANHALYKSLLFLASGAILHGARTAAFDELGGLGRRMRVTAGVFLVGCIAIAGLPPLNGFMSELLIAWGALAGLAGLAGSVAIPSAAALMVVAVVGALVLAGFVKAFGIIFLGAPRRSDRGDAHEAPLTMRLALLWLAVLCLAMSAASPWLVPFAIAHWVAPLVRIDPAIGAQTGGTLLRVNLVALAVLAISGGLALLRWLLLRGRDVRQSVTWDCGYAAPSASMQYTGSSFSQPIVQLYQSFLRTRVRVEPPEQHFPDAAHVATETPDLSREGVYEPLFEAIENTLRRLRILQHGRVQIYVLGVVLTLLALLLVQVG